MSPVWLSFCDRVCIALFQLAIYFRGGKKLAQLDCDSAENVPTDQLE